MFPSALGLPFSSSPRWFLPSLGLRSQSTRLHSLPGGFAFNSFSFGFRWDLGGERGAGHNPLHPGCSSVSQLAEKVGCRRGGGQETNSRPCALHPKPGSETMVRQGLWVELRDRQGPLCLCHQDWGSRAQRLFVVSTGPESQIPQ